MKRLIYLLMTALCVTMFTACSDDDKNDIPINGLEIPKFENPVAPGQTITIKGEGFDEGSEIWFRKTVTRAEDNDDVKAEVVSVNGNGITFIAPSVYGNQTVLLKQDGREYELGEMLFANEPADVKILPRKIKRITEIDDCEEEYIYEYEYYADGRIKSCNMTDSETDLYTYSDNTISIRNDEDENRRFNFILENGRIKSCSLENDDWKQDYEFEYEKEGYLSKSVMVDDENEQETETFSFVEGNLVKYTYSCKELKEWKGSIEFIYGEQPNNLNIDLFYFIGEYYFDSNIDLAFQLNLIGKRSRYLPVKMIITDSDWDEDDENIIHETYIVNINYKMNGEYISEFTIKDEESKENGELFWTTFTFEYED